MNTDRIILVAFALMLVAVLVMGYSLWSHERALLTTPVPTTPQPATHRIHQSVHEITIDGCQYLVYEDYKRGGICHKANCTNHE